MRGSPQMTIGAVMRSIEDLGVAAQQVLDEQSVLQKAQDERVLLEDAGRIEAALLAHGPAQDVQPMLEVGGTEVVQGRSPPRPGP